MLEAGCINVTMKTRDVKPDDGDAEKLWSTADAKVFGDSGWTVPRSITGIAGKAYGMLVISKTNLQSTVSLSSTVSEIQGQRSATLEAIWMRIFLLEHLRLTKYEADTDGLLKIPIYGDNMGATKFAREHCTSSKLKSVPLAYYFCYESSQSGKVGYHQIATLLNIADFWTKAHGAASLDRHRSQWMMKWAPKGK